MIVPQFGSGQLKKWLLPEQQGKVREVFIIIWGTLGHTSDPFAWSLLLLTNPWDWGGNSHPFLPILGLPSTFMVFPTKIGFKRNINNSFPRQLDYNIWILFLITGNWIFSNSVLLYSFGSKSYSLFQGYWIRQACESKGQVIGKTKIS